MPTRKETYQTAPREQHTLCVLVDNEFGSLSRVIELFSGRGYNIESLTVSEVDTQRNLSRITVVTSGPQQMIDQIKALLLRLVPVHRVSDLTTECRSVERELVLVKVAGIGERRLEAMRIAEIFRAHVVDATNESFVFEMTGNSEKIDTFIDLMQPLGLKEVCRTGIVGIARGSESLFDSIEI